MANDKNCGFQKVDNLKMMGATMLLSFFALLCSTTAADFASFSVEGTQDLLKEWGLHKHLGKGVKTHVFVIVITPIAI